MNREVKFRAWNDIDKMIIDWSVLRASPVFFTNIIKGKVKHHNLMQYTGLKDKSGAEIYQGDLIKNRSGRVCEVAWDDANGLFDAIPINAGGGGTSHGFEVCSWGDHVEVVGHIHENPELLEKK